MVMAWCRNFGEKNGMMRDVTIHSTTYIFQVVSYNAKGPLADLVSFLR